MPAIPLSETVPTKRPPVHQTLEQFLELVSRTFAASSGSYSSVSRFAEEHSLNRRAVTRAFAGDDNETLCKVYEKLTGRKAQIVTYIEVEI